MSALTPRPPTRPSSQMDNTPAPRGASNAGQAEATAPSEANLTSEAGIAKTGEITVRWIGTPTLDTRWRPLQQPQFPEARRPTIRTHCPRKHSPPDHRAAPETRREDKTSLLGHPKTSTTSSQEVLPAKDARVETAKEPQMTATEDAHETTTRNVHGDSARNATPTKVGVTKRAEEGATTTIAKASAENTTHAVEMNP
jgi:hypothetical protein